MFSIATLVLALSAVATTVSAGCSREYTVKPGDICDSISKEHSVSSYQLLANNPQINDRCFNLEVNELLCLGTTPNEDCKQIYTVKPNDSCEIIQAASGINSTLLMTNNPQIAAACDNLYIGQVLCVAQSPMVPPVPANGIPTPSAAATPAASQHTVAASSATHATKTVTSDYAAATSSTPEPIDSSGDPNDESLPWCDEL